MNSVCFIEERKASARGTVSLAADISRHLHSRQYLGKTTIICDNPRIMLSAIRKQWLKLSRIIQKQRASTLNADKLLKYTHTITHMQNMKFTCKFPADNPSSDVYILPCDGAQNLPPQCWSLYICEFITPEMAQILTKQMPADALLVDYHQLDLGSLGLTPKAELEQRVKNDWEQAAKFLHNYKIDITNFTDGPRQNVDAIDDALDILLTVSHKFLDIAKDFQRTLEMARPLKLSKATRQKYDDFILLAHRVQALCTTPFNQHFIQAYNQDDTFFLQDRGKQILAALLGSDRQAAILQHENAGRYNLAEALKNSVY